MGVGLGLDHADRYSMFHDSYLMYNQNEQFHPQKTSLYLQYITNTCAVYVTYDMIYYTKGSSGHYQEPSFTSEVCAQCVGDTVCGGHSG